MRLGQLLSLCTLVLATVAAPPRIKRSDIVLPPGAYWESESVVVLPNEPLTLDEVEELDRRETLAARDKMLGFCGGGEGVGNVSASASGSTDLANAEYIVDVWTTNKPPQAIGTLRGDRWFQILYNCFKTLCPTSAGRAKCWEARPGSGLPSCKINNIVTEPKRDGRYDTSASIVIGARAISSTSNTWGLDITTYDFVSDIYKAMTQVESNCYYVDFKGSRKTRLCNVADSVLVAFPFKKSTDIPRTLFIATVQSSVVGEVGGTYKCSDGLKSKITEVFNSFSYQQRFSNFVGGWKDHVGLRVNCVEHECMVPKEDKWKKCADRFN